MAKKNRLKIIIPALNEEATIYKTIESLSKQDLSVFTDITLCVVNDGSRDNTSGSAKLAFEKGFNKDSRFIVIEHDKPKGISKSLNDGLQDYKEYDYILISQSDILLDDKDAINKLLQKIESKNLDAAYPHVVHVRELWESYPFWQKILLDRQLDRRAESKVAKLCLFTSQGVDKAGLFDEDITGTEDRDYFERIYSKGKIEATDVDVIHIHNAAKNFSWKKLVYKEGQQAEGSACMIRRYGFSKNLIDTVLTLFRPVIAIMNLLPYLRWVSIPLTLLFFFYYSKNTIIYTLTKKFDWRIFLIIPVLSYSLYVSLVVFIISLFNSKVNFYRNK